MFDNFIAQIKREVADLEDMSDVAAYVGRKDREVIALMMDLQKLAFEVEDNIVVGQIDKQAEMLDMLKAELERTALSALEETKEFDIPAYRQGLIKAIQSDQSYDITYRGNEDYLTIKVNLDLTAGTLRDYGAAVNAARREMSNKDTGSRGVGKYSKRPMSAEMASEMWKNKYYRPAREGTEIPQPKLAIKKDKKGKEKKQKPRKYNTAQYIQKYWDTMAARVASFRGYAPFWRILNYGTQPLHSDWGGTAYPDFGPTWFVEKAVRKVQLIYTTVEVKPEDNPASEQIRAEIVRLNEASDFLEEKQKELELALAEIEDPKTEHEFTIVEVRSALGARFGQADISKVFDLIQRLERGEVDPNKKVWLTKRGGEVVRPRIKKIYNEIQAYKAGLV